MNSVNVFVDDPNHCCWTCAHWRGETGADDAHAVCRHRGGLLVIGKPDAGCAYWEPCPTKSPELFDLYGCAEEATES
ncbi:hypothetical protein ACFOEY_10065 [Paracandidimonas soli]